MKRNAVNKDVNGWSVICKWLTMKGKRQGDLADLLNVTASAVSQIKSGNILLNARQISLILDYLEIDPRDMCILYTLIFNARLTDKVGKTQYSDRKLIVNIANSDNEADISVSSEIKDTSSGYKGSFRHVPLMTFKQAMNYEPAVESIEAFANCFSNKTVAFSNAPAGSFALEADELNATPEFGHSTILLVAGGEYPVDGDMVVAKLRTGKVITKYYLRRNNVIHLHSKTAQSEDFTWHYQDDPSYIHWMYPIVEANLKLRAGNYNFSI